MLYQPPEETLLIAKMRQAEIRADVNETRDAIRSGQPRRALGEVSGLQLRLGRLLIVVGRTLHEDESPCPDLIRS